METRNLRKVRQGVVISNKMDKTIVIAAKFKEMHPIYGKFVQKTKKYPVSNEIVKDIEDNISSLISKLNDKSSNEEIDNIIKLIENRNDIIKRNK